MKILIIDDEADSRKLLQNKLSQIKKYPFAVSEAAGVQQGIEMLKSDIYDLIFLDIRMPDGSGFDLLAALPDLETPVAFCTAYDEFAVKAFEFTAIGYLLKPVDVQQLEAVVNRAQEKIQGSQPQYRLLVESYQERKIRKIVIPNASGFLISEIGEVIYVQSDGNYSEFHFFDKDSKVVSSKTLKEYQNLLLPEGFFRIHQSYLINLNHVREYRRAYSEVMMSNGDALPVARQRRTAFQEVFL